MLVPEEIEEERRLCYVGMTRAMDQLILTRAVYRRRYGTDLPEASVPSRFLEEVPGPLIEELGTRRVGRLVWGPATYGRASRSEAALRSIPRAPLFLRGRRSERIWHAARRSRQSLAPRNRRWLPALQLDREHCRVLRQPREEVYRLPRAPVEEPTGKRGFRPGQKVRHPKYGEGTVYQREGEGEEAKITVQFPRFGLKKLVEKYAQLERA